MYSYIQPAASYNQNGVRHHSIDPLIIETINDTVLSIQNAPTEFIPISNMSDAVRADYAEDTGQDWFTLMEEKRVMAVLYCDSVSWDGKSETRNHNGSGSAAHPFRCILDAIEVASCMVKYMCCLNVLIKVTGVIDYDIKFNHGDRYVDYINADGVVLDFYNCNVKDGVDILTRRGTFRGLTLTSGSVRMKECIKFIDCKFNGVTLRRYEYRDESDDIHEDNFAAYHFINCKLTNVYEYFLSYTKYVSTDVTTWNVLYKCSTEGTALRCALIDCKCTLIDDAEPDYILTYGVGQFVFTRNTEFTFIGNEFQLYSANVYLCNDDMTFTECIPIVTVLSPKIGSAERIEWYGGAWFNIDYTNPHCRVYADRIIHSNLEIYDFVAKYVYDSTIKAVPDIYYEGPTIVDVIIDSTIYIHQAHDEDYYYLRLQSDTIENSNITIVWNCTTEGDIYSKNAVIVDYIADSHVVLDWNISITDDLGGYYISAIKANTAINCTGNLDVSIDRNGHDVYFVGCGIMANTYSNCQSNSVRINTYEDGVMEPPKLPESCI